MIDFEKLTEPINIELLIALYDIHSFARYTHNKSSTDIFKFLNELAEIAGEIIEPVGGKIIKFIGDSGLIVFPKELVDEGVRAMIELQQRSKTFLQQVGLTHLYICCHYGEATIGPFGTRTSKYIDVLGHQVNKLFITENTYGKNDFLVTEQAFQVLNSDTKKFFHKFSLPNIYIMNE